MNAKKIVIAYLKENGYDGLAGDDCGCGIDDFAPCGEGIGYCKPAYKVKADCDNCDVRCDAVGVADYCYKTKKGDCL